MADVLKPIFEVSPTARQFHPGMGQAVAERTVLRRKNNGEWESWGDVAHRVALGNSLLSPNKDEQEEEYRALNKHLSKATLLMSGRHLQHGDENQPIRNQEVFTNCFHGETKVLTLEYGPVSLRDIVGKEVTIRSADGEFRKATCSSHGKQKLYLYEFGGKTSNLNKDPIIKVAATKNHRWFLSDGTITTCLSLNDTLLPQRYNVVEDLEAVRHGLIFGDGSAHKSRLDYQRQWVSQGRSYCAIRLCGNDKNYLNYFEGYTISYPPHANGDPVVYLGKKPLWKDLPFTTDPDYIAGFIKGWWLADGNKTYPRENFIVISTTRDDAVEWMKNYASYAGYIITRINKHDRKVGDGSYPNGKPLYEICFAKAENKPRKVRRITELGEEEVYCLEEPVTSGFVLANGLLTGNCATSSTSFILFYLLLNGCFRKGTKVKMADGSYKPIEEVQSGDEVVSFDEKTEQFINQKVLRLNENKPKSMVKVHLENGEDIVCTVDHKFLTEDGEWIEAQYLAGKNVKQQSKNKIEWGVMKVESVEFIESNDSVVYDLTVENTHNYLVSESDIVVHNSGVGRSYDDDLMLVNWDNAPTVRCVLDESHPDFDWSAHESVRDAQHKYDSGRDTFWFKVPDSREGWAKALEIWENAAFEKIHRDKMFILDFSEVRPKGAPIGGMQNRPASGPVPLMNAFIKAGTLKGAKLSPWRQAMYIDHYFAECVLVGGARRAARMSTKIWTDPTVLDFITVKRPIEFLGKSVSDIIGMREECAKNKKSSPLGFLWSSNNSVAVDEEFWRLVALKRTDEAYQDPLAKHARKVFRLSTEASYADGTGEPGFINVDKLVRKDAGWDEFKGGDFVGSKKYQLREQTELFMSKLARRAKQLKYNMITNPCLTADVIVKTSVGEIQMDELVRRHLSGEPMKVLTNSGEYRMVNAAGLTRKNAEVMELIFEENGVKYKLTCTPDHKIFTSNRGWIEAQELTDEDEVVVNK